MPIFGILFEWSLKIGFTVLNFGFEASEVQNFKLL